MSTALHKYPAFQKQTCPVTGQQTELDPIYGLGLDALASQIRGGQIPLTYPWALYDEIGFETRFHAVKVCNFSFQVLHPGFTRGSMLVNFREDLQWMRNLHLESGPVPTDLQGVPGAEKNHWRKFLRAVIPPPSIQFDWSPDEGFSVQAVILVNGESYPSQHTTAVGTTVPVRGLPVEVPVRFQDLDYLLTDWLLTQDQDQIPTNILKDSRFGLSKFESLERLSVQWDTLSAARSYGAGALTALWMTCRKQTPVVPFPVPQLAPLRAFTG